MSAMSGEPDSTAVLAVKIDNLTQIVEHLREDIRAQSETFVRRDVYEEKTRALDREIVALRRDIDARRVPWTAVVAAVVSVVSLAVVLIPQLAG